MFGASGLSDELQSLKTEVSRRLSNAGDSVAEAAGIRADAFAEQIKVALSELGETLSEQESRVEALVAERPVAAMASALALGVVVGFILRRH